MRSTPLRSAAVLSLITLAAAAAPALAETAGAEPERATERSTTAATIAVDELRPGQRGYGLTVFAGREPERFEAEVIGVMRNVAPETSYILARLTGHGLEESGVAGGMSGSPVFFDGRLAGAVAFSWPFTNEAIAGITPIDAMRRIPSEVPPLAPPEVGPGPVPVTAAGGVAAGGAGARGSWAAAGVPPSPVTALDLATRRLPEGLLERELARLAPPMTGGAVSGLQWSAAGFGPGSEALLRRALGNVAPSGQAAPDVAGARLVPGSPVSAVLIDGDFRLAATGTVTDVLGEDILAFGHSFLGVGPLSVPMASAEVVTVLSSRYSSFKIANVGSVVGAIEQDRQVGVRGRIGAEAPTVPLTVTIDGPEQRVFRMRLAAVPQVTPALVAISSLAALDAASHAGGLQGLDLEARFHLAGHSDLALAQSFDGDTPGARAVVSLLAYAAFLLQNEMQAVAIEEIEVTLRQVPEPRIATLVSAHAERSVVRPGDSVKLHLDFQAYRGEPFRRDLDLTLPPSLPDGRYHLLVGDGASVDAARLAVEQTEPVTLRQALTLLRSLHSNRELVVLGVRDAPGLAVAGEVLPQLPGTLRSIWAAAGPGGAQPLRLAVAQTESVPMPVPVTGLLRVDLRVERREPLTAGEVGGEASAGEEAGEEAAPPDGEEAGDGETAGAGADGAAGAGAEGAPAAGAAAGTGETDQGGAAAGEDR
jgi:hypothetical protein